MHIRGADYHVAVRGKGRPVLFLHGFTGDHSTWDETLAYLPESMMCIRIDLPGHGKTVMPDDSARFTVEETCKDLCGVLDALSIEQADLVGYSMGGRVALSMACLHPDKVTRLILESASPGLREALARETRRAADEQLAQFIENKGVEAFVEKWEEIPLFQSQKNLPDEIQQQIRAQRIKNRPQGLAQSLRGMGTGKQPSWWERLPKLKTETILFTGEKDKKFCAIAQEMDEQLPNSKKVVIQGSGHAIHVEQPQKFGTMLMEFLLKG
ncbi:2-succinyl-6-hydroxy-2,4-cyclohexadiene-1-carboxylate synthase [Jeotgalibacillus sp. S-D1]|nr:2-succinyl-6-hydroxy-2,4-cyclohexadiene-1-carboxylate synthase [Jeotgalibacillus sp. S-D1]